MKTVQITTAIKPNQETRNAIEQVLSEKFKDYNLDFQYEVEPNIIGGLKVFVDGYVYDASLLSQLNQLILE